MLELFLALRASLARSLGVSSGTVDCCGKLVLHCSKVAHVNPDRRASRSDTRDSTSNRCCNPRRVVAPDTAADGSKEDVGAPRALRVQDRSP